MTARGFSPLMVGCMVLFGLTAAAQDTTKLEQRGRALVERHCSRCHAIDITGSSCHAGVHVRSSRRGRNSCRSAIDPTPAIVRTSNYRWSNESKIDCLGFPDP